MLATLPQQFSLLDATSKIVIPTVARPHVANNSGNNEWYTPPEYIEAARQALGQIDTDPASCDSAQRVVQAKTYYTAQTDGLRHKWTGKVWMNPPYAGNLVGKFADKLAHHYECGDVTDAVVLVNNATETEWFNRLIGVASAVVFPSSRIKFWNDNGVQGAPLQAQAVLYLGKDAGAFLSAFCKFGWGAAVVNADVDGLAMHWDGD
jgi:hypothetical protein